MGMRLLALSSTSLLHVNPITWDVTPFYEQYDNPHPNQQPSSPLNSIREDHAEAVESMVWDPSGLQLVALAEV